MSRVGDLEAVLCEHGWMVAWKTAPEYGTKAVEVDGYLDLARGRNKPQAGITFTEIGVRLDSLLADVRSDDWTVLEAKLDTELAIRVLGSDALGSNRPIEFSIVAVDRR